MMLKKLSENLTWRKIKRIGFDHPYFDYLKRTGHLLSDKEAERILADFPTFEQMIESAKKKSGLPPEAWKDFDDVIANRALRQKHRK